MIESLVTVTNDRQDPQHHEHGKYIKYIKTLEVSQILLVYLDMTGMKHLSDQIADPDVFLDVTIFHRDVRHMVLLCQM